MSSAGDGLSADDDINSRLAFPDERIDQCKQWRPRSSGEGEGQEVEQDESEERD
jgi:hypothetical protein